MVLNTQEVESSDVDDGLRRWIENRIPEANIFWN